MKKLLYYFMVLISYGVSIGIMLGITYLIELVSGLRLGVAIVSIMALGIAASIRPFIKNWILGKETKNKKH